MAKQNDNSGNGQSGQEQSQPQKTNETTKPYRDITPYEERSLTQEEVRKKSN